MRDDPDHHWWCGFEVGEPAARVQANAQVGFSFEDLTDAGSELFVADGDTELAQEIDPASWWSHPFRRACAVNGEEVWLCFIQFEAELQAGMLSLDITGSLVAQDKATCPLSAATIRHAWMDQPKPEWETPFRINQLSRESGG